MFLICRKIQLSCWNQTMWYWTISMLSQLRWSRHSMMWCGVYSVPLYNIVTVLVTHTANTLLCFLQDNVLVLAATHRYKQKYVTTLMYKPIWVFPHVQVAHSVFYYCHYFTEQNGTERNETFQNLAAFVIIKHRTCLILSAAIAGLFYPFVTMGNVLAKAAVLDFSIQWTTFLIASFLRSERFFDATGSVTFLILLLQSLMHTRKFFPRQVIQSGLVSTWAARLGMFLVTRILRDGHDSRFNHVRDNPKRFFFYWTVQGTSHDVAVLFCMAPLLFCTEVEDERNVLKNLLNTFLDLGKSY